MFQCPVCAEVLARTAAPAGLLWRCGACQGTAATLPVLRRIAAAEAVSPLAHLGGAAIGAACDVLWRDLDARRATRPPPRPKLEWR